MVHNKIELNFNDILMRMMNDVSAIQTDIATLTANSMNHTASLNRLEVYTKEEHTRLNSRINDSESRLATVEQDIIKWHAKLSGAVKTITTIWIITIAVIGVVISIKGLK